MKNKQTFKLSKSGRLSRIVAYTLISTVSLPSLAAGIVPIIDSSHVTVTTSGTGALIVNIAKPNNSGLSHNKYNDFNVSNAGAILNNATSQSQSKILNKMLNGNKNLTNKSADVILNEVISRNPSMLLGDEEVLGHTADLILANPNGITCDGCGFINTNKSSLIVGKSHLENAVLKGFNTNNNGKLTVGRNGINANDVLDLIAPTINSNGLIRTTNAVNIVVGHNNVNAKGQVIEKDPKLTSTSSLDSNLLGGMNAGRINIVSTDAGTGVNISGDVTSNEGLQVNSKGDLHITGAKVSAQDIDLQAENITSEAKILHRESLKDNSGNYSKYNGGKSGESKRSYDVITETELTGKNISIRSHNNTEIKASNINSDNLSVIGDNVMIGQQTTADDSQLTDNNWHLSWIHNQEDKKHEGKIHGSTINTEHKALIKATSGDINIEASQIKSNDDLSLSASKNINIDGKKEIRSTSKSVYQKNEGASLNTGSSSDSLIRENLIQSSLESGNKLGSDAANSLDIKAAKLEGKDVILNAGKDITISSDKATDTTESLNNQHYWGGIGGGNNKNNTSSHDQVFASTIHSDNDLLLSANADISVNGSNILGDHEALVKTTKGKVTIDNAIGNDKSVIDERNGTAFNITKHSENKVEDKESVISSYLTSDTNLQIVGDNGVHVSGSILKSAGELGIRSLGDIEITSAESNTKQSESKTNLGTSHKAHSNEEMQYELSGGLTHLAESSSTDSATQTKSLIAGGNISINSDKDVSIVGTKIKSEKNTDINATNITIKDATNKATELKGSTETGVSATTALGIDKGGVGVHIGVDKVNTTITDTKAQNSEIATGGDLTINAENNINNKGTAIKSEGNTSLRADTITNEVSEDTHNESTQTVNVGVDTGINAEYGKITKPIVNIAKKVISDGISNPLGLINAGSEVSKVLSGAVMPNLGGEIGTDVSNRNNSAGSTTSNKTEISGKSVNVTARNVSDQATSYHGKQDVTINTDSYSNLSATDTVSKTSKEVSGNGSLRGYTSTGADINGDANSKVTGNIEQSHESKAVTANITSDNGNVSLTGDTQVTMEGSKIKANSGIVNVKSLTGDITSDQATNSASSSKGEWNSDFGLTAGTLPTSKNYGGNIGGGYESKSGSTSTGSAAEIKGNSIKINAGHDIALKGTKLSGNESDKGDLNIGAGHSVELNQISNTTESASSNYQGHINVNKNTSKTDGSIGSGFDATYANNAKTKVDADMAKIADIKNVTVTSGSDLTMNGVDVGSDGHKVENIKLYSEGNIAINAAKSSSQENGINVSTNLNGTNAKDVSVGGKAEFGYINQGETTQKGSKLEANNDVSLTSKGDQGISIQGTDISSVSTSIDADSHVAISGLESKEHHNNISFGVNGDLVKTNVDTKSSKGGIELKTNVSTGNSDKFENAKINSKGSITIKSNETVSISDASITSETANISAHGDIGIKSNLSHDQNKSLVLDAGGRVDDNKDSSALSKVTDAIASLVPSEEGKSIVKDAIEAVKDKAVELSTPQDEKASGWKRFTNWVTSKTDKAVNSPIGKQVKISGSISSTNNSAVHDQTSIIANKEVNLSSNGELSLNASQIQSPNNNLEVKGIKLSELDQSHSNIEFGLKGSTSLSALAKQTVSGVMGGQPMPIKYQNSHEQSKLNGEIIKK